MLLFNHSVMSDYLWPYGLHLPRLLVFHHILEIAQTRVHWVDEVIPPSHLCHCLFLLPSIFPASGYFLKSQLFASGSPSIIASASASVLPMNIQGEFPLGLTGLIFLQSKRLWGVFSSATLQEHQFFGPQPSLWSNSHICTWLLEKLWQTFVGKVMSLLFNMLSTFVIAFLFKQQVSLILWLQSPSAVILQSKKIKSVTVSTFSPSICCEALGLDAMILVFCCCCLFF